MRGVAIHALLASLALYAAYATWTREPEAEAAPEGQVTILACTPDRISEVVFESPTNLITLRPDQDGGQRVYRAEDQYKRVERKPKPTTAEDAADGGVADAGAADAGVASKPSKPEQPPVPPFRYLVGDAFDGYLARIAPLRGSRGLGVIPQERFEEFGLNEVGTHVRIRCGEQALSLDVGGRTFGSGQRYVRDPQSGKVYLVDKTLVSDLQSARFKFMRKSPHSFGMQDVERAEVAASGQLRTLLHRDRQQRRRDYWVDAAAPDQRNELFGNWMSRVEGLKIRAYLEPGAEPGADLDAAPGEAGAPEPVVEIAYSAEGKPLGKLELVSVKHGQLTHYYVRSEATHGWAVLNSAAAQQVADDVASVVGSGEAQ